MKNKHHKAGFTLLEVMVAVVIVGILSAFAVSSYTSILERMKLSEADRMMGDVFRAQQRYRVRTQTRYARYWGQLDMAPADLHGSAGRGVTVYCTKDQPQPKDGNCLEDGFKITLYGSSSKEDYAGIVSERVNNHSYSYKVARLYNDKDAIYCAAGEMYPEKDRLACADFMGVEEYDPSAEEVIASIEALAEEE